METNPSKDQLLTAIDFYEKHKHDFMFESYYKCWFSFTAEDKGGSMRLMKNGYAPGIYKFEVRPLNDFGKLRLNEFEWVELSLKDEDHFEIATNVILNWDYLYEKRETQKKT